MNKTHIKSVILIFLIAVLARLIFLFAVYEPLADRFNWGHHPGRFNWYSDDSYDEITRNLLDGKGFSHKEKPNIERAPVYPLILAVQFFLFGNGYYINVFINIIYQSAAAIILYFLTLLIFNNQKAGIISSLIWAMHPLPMLQAMGPFTEPVYELFLVSFAYFFYKFYLDKKNRYLLYFSLLMLIMTLTKPITIIFPLFFIVVSILLKQFSIKTKIKQCTILLSIFLVGIAPWIYRGYTITGKILPLVSYKPLKNYLQKDENSVPYSEYNFKNKFIKEIKNPLAFTKNTFTRMMRFWYYGHSHKIRIINALVQFPFLLLSLLGILWAKKHHYLIFPILIIICYFWLAYGAIHAVSRYSFPLIILFCPFAAIKIINMFTTQEVQHEKL